MSASTNLITVTRENGLVVSRVPAESLDLTSVVNNISNAANTVSATLSGLVDPINAVSSEVSSLKNSVSAVTTLVQQDVSVEVLDGNVHVANTPVRLVTKAELDALKSGINA